MRIDHELTYNIICNIDSLFFEFNSACELISKLLDSLYSHANRPLNKNGAELKIKSIIENSKQDSSWFRELDVHRNLFTHNATPYIAIDITNESSYDLLIMKENLKYFEDEKRFIRLSDLQNIVSGFINSKDIIQDDLINLFKSQ